MIATTPDAMTTGTCPVIMAGNSTTPYARGKRPLLRGTLVDLGEWVDCPGRPGMQTRYATIVALRRLAAPPRLEAIRRLAAMEGDGQPAAVAIISVAEAAARIDGTAVGVAPVEL